MFQLNRDRILLAALSGLAAVSGLLVIAIAAFVLKEAVPAFTHIGVLRFVTDDSWHPAAEAQSGTFYLLPIILGTMLSSAGAIALAAPLGILSAIFLRVYAPRSLVLVYRRIIELMAGVPSVVYGLWSLGTLVPLIGRLHPPGQSLLAGIIILTIMILPTVALLADSAFAAVPRQYITGAAALGFSRATTAICVIVPAARSGIIAAIILALARALGETMAVVMVCGNVVRVPGSPFDPVRTLTGTIALEMGYARSDHRASLFFCGLMLLILVASLVLFVELIRRATRHAAN